MNLGIADGTTKIASVWCLMIEARPCGAKIFQGIGRIGCERRFDSKGAVVLHCKSAMKIHLKIDGMTCQNCVRHVRGALQKVAGVESAEVDLDQGAASVQTGDGTVAAELIQAVQRAGYKAEAVGG
jgi:copper chaperone CopZ